MASGHAKTGSVSVALKVYLLALFVGLYHFESNKTRQKPSYLFVRDKLPMITALLANQPVLGDKVKHRGKHYLPGRILHTSNGTSSFQIEKHLLICGDVSSNPGPSEKPKAKYPCGECHKNVRNNQDAILCAICKSWFHAKCLNMSRNIFCYYLAHPDIDWTCALCSLPPVSDSFFSEDSVRFEQTEFSVDMHDFSGEGIYANQDLDTPQELEAKRTNSSKELLLCHLNINSIQNKFDELVDVIHKLKAHIIFIGETKIDSTYPNSQFYIPGYSLFRKDRKKGGGGILAFVSAVIPCKRLNFNRTYKCIEAIELEITVGRKEMILIGMYRPPRALTGSYQLALEDELSHICNWAYLQRGIVAVIGDLNLDRLRPNRSEGKLVIDLESEQGFECLIKEPTRIEKKGAITTSTLIDVLLTNRPGMFMQCGTYDTALSDHLLIYGLMKETVKRYQNKIVTFRNYKNCDMEVYTNKLATAPWHVGDLFDDVDDQEYHWKTLMKDIVDECFPLKKMRVRYEDVPYMTTSWKNAIRAKRRAAAKYYKDKSAHNWEVKQRCRNEATRQRRIAIKQYWKKKANNKLTTNSKEFFKTSNRFWDRRLVLTNKQKLTLKLTVLWLVIKQPLPRL